MGKKSKTRRRQGFLEDYRLDSTYLLAPERSSGRAGILYGEASDGTPVVVKVWPRQTKVEDSDLEEIWRHELRQLHRLMGYPGAYDNIPQLRTSGVDDHGFYLVFEPGQRRPLEVALKYLPSGHWLKQPRLAANRVRIWANLRRICLALEILHGQGLLHRNIDRWAILTAGVDEPDFQLSGFEWSMRLAASRQGARPAQSVVSNIAQQYSFQHDWLMFGLLAAGLLGIAQNRVLDLRIAPYEIADHIGAEEARLLRAIVHSDPTIQGGGEVIARRIDELASSLHAEVAGLDAKLHIALRLGGSSLSQRIRQASQDEIETDDIQGQLAFVKDDLSDAPMLLAVRSRAHEPPRLIIRGIHLHYQLQQYQHRRESSSPTWDIAYCDGAEVRSPAPVNLLNQMVLDPQSLDIMGIREAGERFPRLRGKLRSWDEIRNELFSEADAPSREEIVHRALTLTQFLDALYAATDVFPVDLLPRPPRTSSANGDVEIWMRPRADTDRELLSTALGLRPLADRLRETLVGDNVREEGWILTDAKSLGERTTHDTEWQFREVKRIPGEPPIYVFTGTSFVPLLQDAFLIPAGSIGRDVQFRRRLKALGALKDHIELLKMLADPRQRIMDSHDPLKRDADFEELDPPKQSALSELTGTLPFYLVQGPPGVGKTRLVRDLVRRRFIDEPMTRILLSAQSNSAVDHLMDELNAVLSVEDESKRPLIVRCCSRESARAHSPFEVGVQSKKIIGELINSAAVQQAPSPVRSRLRQLATAYEIETDHPEAASPHASPSLAVRSFESLVVRAANVVFATTNSAELERLIDEKGQFDWAVVEEAGKATGSELVSPLLLSHRRLMIGDHKQLPPFGSDQTKKLLESPEHVRAALVIGEEFIGRALRDATIEEILDEVEDVDNELPALCAEAIRVLTLFESIIERELQRQAEKRPGRPIARKLTSQHRMHPVIAGLVSECFYRGELETSPARKAFFAETNPPVKTLDPIKMPIAPITVIDMPYVQSTVGMTVGDTFPRWHNPNEVSAVVEVLSHLRVVDSAEKKPSLTVLSPYAQQVKRLNKAIDEAWNARLAHLSEFLTPPGDEICRTVDAFQGNEADVVVVSLVRNNHHAGVRNALGFLSDYRRMNVLLSRARWQLVVVGSLEFLKAVVAGADNTENEESIAFLSTMLKYLAGQEKSGAVARVTEAKILGVGQ